MASNWQSVNWYQWKGSVSATQQTSRSTRHLPNINTYLQISEHLPKTNSKEYTQTCLVMHANSLSKMGGSYKRTFPFLRMHVQLFKHPFCWKCACSSFVCLCHFLQSTNAHTSEKAPRELPYRHSRCGSLCLSLTLFCQSSSRNAGCLQCPTGRLLWQA